MLQFIRSGICDAHFTRCQAPLQWHSLCISEARTIDHDGKRWQEDQMRQVVRGLP
jgi:hypothetical protein